MSLLYLFSRNVKTRKLSELSMENPMEALTSIFHSVIIVEKGGFDYFAVTLAPLGSQSLLYPVPHLHQPIKLVVRTLWAEPLQCTVKKSYLEVPVDFPLNAYLHL